jgi:predicted MPP superfamily phosphohydrolase
MLARIRRLAAILTLLLLAASHVAAGDKDFSIVVLPDPQHYASKYHSVGMAQTEWIAERANKLPIKFVVSVGDNVDHGWKGSEFKQSVAFMDKLKGAVPYGVACGNHDLLDGKKKSYTSQKFVDYYGPHNFKKYPWYGGASPSGFSSYQTFSGGGIKFLALEVTVAAPKEEIVWAKKVMGDHPDLPVILTTHQMLNPKGELGKGTAASGPTRQTPSHVWEQLIGQRRLA